MPEDVQDLVAEKLTEIWIEVYDYQLSNFADVEGNGEKGFRKGNVEIVYRLKNPKIVVIVLYRILKKPKGIQNPFKEFNWFLEFLNRDDIPVERIEGVAKEFPGEHVSTLSVHRLKKFYKKWLGAKSERNQFGQEWLYGYLKDYRPLRHFRDLQKSSSREESTLWTLKMY